MCVVDWGCWPTYPVHQPRGRQVVVSPKRLSRHEGPHPRRGCHPVHVEAQVRPHHSAGYAGGLGQEGGAVLTKWRRAERLLPCCVGLLASGGRHQAGGNSALGVPSLVRACHLRAMPDPLVPGVGRQPRRLRPWALWHLQSCWETECWQRSPRWYAHLCACFRLCACFVMPPTPWRDRSPPPRVFTSIPLWWLNYL